MKHSSERSLETKKQKNEFQDRLQSVTTRQLHGTDGLVEYANVAIAELADIVEDVLATYAVEASDIPLESQAAERAALEHFNLKPDTIDTVLLNLMVINTQIQEIIGDSVDSEARVFVPPMQSETPVQIGSGNGFEHASIQPRAATIKFLIARLLNVNWNELKKSGRADSRMGQNRPEMIRQASYQLIISKDFDRSIMVCDEVGNRTFVFSHSELTELGITDDALVDMNKEELDELIRTNPGIGADLIYNEETFVDSVGALLTNNIESYRAGNETATELLLPFIDDTVHTANQITIAINKLYGSKLSHKTVIDIAKTLAQEGLVSGQWYRTGPRRTMQAYDYDEFEVIHQRLGEKDLLYPVAGEDDISFPNTLANQLGLAGPTIVRIAEEAGIVVADLPMKRFQGVSALSCSQDDVERIKVFIDKNPDALSQKSKVGTTRLLSREAIVRAVGTGAGWNAIKKIGENLGFDPSDIPNPDAPEVDTIRQEALRLGFIEPPEGYRSLHSISDEENIQYRDLIAALEQLGDGLGEVLKHVYGPRPRLSYSPDQQKLILQTAKDIVDKRSEQRTNERLTVPEIAKELGVTGHVIRTALKRIDAVAVEQLVMNKPSPTYDSSVLDVLREDSLVKESINATKAPENVIVGSTFSRELHVGQPTVERIAKKYHMPIGTFKFGPKISKGYFPFDRDYIANILEDEKLDRHG